MWSSPLLASLGPKLSSGGPPVQFSPTAGGEGSAGARAGRSLRGLPWILPQKTATSCANPTGAAPRRSPQAGIPRKPFFSLKKVKTLPRLAACPVHEEAGSPRPALPWRRRRPPRRELAHIRAAAGAARCLPPSRFRWGPFPLPVRRIPGTAPVPLPG